jgi:hypothetical protein
VALVSRTGKWSAPGNAILRRRLLVFLKLRNAQAVAVVGSSHAIGFNRADGARLATSVFVPLLKVDWMAYR